ncbi:MAG: hypothetical protein WBF33_32460 [Candidatus Nitrosopolaris sp.]
MAYPFKLDIKYPKSDSVLKNRYNLQNTEDRKELFNEYLINKLPSLDFSQFDENIDFLCRIGLSDEWLNVDAITIGEVICPISLPSETMETLGDLVKDLMSGKITRMTDDKQIDAMKSNLQATGQRTAQSGNYYDFYKNIDTDDLLKEYNKRYHSRTAVGLVNYFKRYADIFFGPEPDTVFFKLKPHKRAWILQALKRFGDYYFWKYNSREVQNLVKTTIERYMLNRDLDMKDKDHPVH